ncbi:MAG: DUF5318 family protein [Acidimicrobiales bacterium]|jgi:hypothetical protein|nr:DUF5318 domain-containing protein [Actinomycetes bacterium]MDP6105064.1 DUF5318 family protein [Acidimicrobiales bacterium]MCP4844629.1 DUF5318 domain-containing protein [Actinomycetes bacterium]MDP6239663.1 DUF5318 family protein [Acidimicrobiales bacterium]MDP7124789.1 DUF5318 family protein [Acidimicrobiales bacterium]|tara:strand:- start:2482 stop:2877 length:396 start_codon:yes stop_codon:yes gene_type:complete
MGFGQAARGLVPDTRTADVDYRLARQCALEAFRNGTLARDLVCDAQPMLRRNAHHCGERTGEMCPICDDHELARVVYVFGPRLPSHGRCLSVPGELARYDARPGTFAAYTVEVCVACAWNHLVRISSIGRG